MRSLHHADARRGFGRTLGSIRFRVAGKQRSGDDEIEARAPRGQRVVLVAYPVIRMSRSGSRGERPRIVIAPRSGKMSPAIRFMSVVLPERWVQQDS